MTMVPGDKFQMVERYNIEQHIEYIISVLSVPKHERWGIAAALEAIAFNLPSSFDYNPEYFLTRFAKFLAKNDVINKPTSDEVQALSDRIIAKYGRNYRLVDLIKAYATIIQTWEIRPGSLE